MLAIEGSPAIGDRAAEKSKSNKARIAGPALLTPREFQEAPAEAPRRTIDFTSRPTMHPRRMNENSD